MKTTRLLSDLSLHALRRALRATIQAAGPDSSSVAAIRRAIAAKQQAARRTRRQGASDAK